MKRVLVCLLVVGGIAMFAAGCKTAEECAKAKPAVEKPAMEAAPKEQPAVEKPAMEAAPKEQPAH